jgi:asparagine synthase (glutamine-hydrolysing)
MCGLAGYIGPADGRAAAESVDTMLRMEVHRGPDSAGVWAKQMGGSQAGIGLRRLRILDLSEAADQPMISPDGRYALVFNGEIYNFVELRAELEQQGIRFRTTGDTEVLLQAVIHWGVDAFNRLNGMWAIVLIDTATSEVLLARDRFGVKPLYTHQAGGALWIASELKAILTASGSKLRVNAKVTKAYLQQGLLNVDRDTFFEGIHEFPAGHFARGTLDAAARGALQPVAYWHLPTTNAAIDGSEADIIARVRDTFMDAVRIRLRSDVPVGVLLSGGCDSSAIAAAVHALFPEREDIRLISAVGRPGQDEEPFIDMMAGHLGRTVDKVRLDYSPSDAFPLVEETVWYNDEPLGGFSSIAHYFLMKRAKDLGVTVLLSGQGADESLCGYKKYLGFFVQELVRTGHFVEAARVLAGFALNGTVLSQFTLAKSKYYLPPWLRAAEQDISGPALRALDTRIDVGLNGHDVRARQALDIESLSVPALVHYEDRMWMSSSREIRLPFLDYRLVSLLVPLPVDLKLRSGWTKWVFRKAVEDIVPAGVTWRKDKQGFITPQLTWFRNELRDHTRRFLAERWLSEDLGLVNRSAIAGRYEAYLRGSVRGATLGVDDFFPAISLELWARRFSSFLAV